MAGTKSGTLKNTQTFPSQGAGVVMPFDSTSKPGA